MDSPTVGDQATVVELLLERGLDVNAGEQGDNTYAMHWAAAAGSLEAVRLLSDAAGGCSSTAPIRCEVIEVIAAR